MNKKNISIAIIGILGILSLLVAAILLALKIIPAYFSKETQNVFNKITSCSLILLIIFCICSFFAYLFQEKDFSNYLLKNCQTLLNWIKEHQKNLISICFALTIISADVHILLWVAALYLSIIITIA